MNSGCSRSPQWFRQSPARPESVDGDEGELWVQGRAVGTVDGDEGGAQQLALAADEGSAYAGRAGGGACAGACGDALGDGAHESAHGSGGGGGGGGGGQISTDFHNRPDSVQPALAEPDSVQRKASANTVAGKAACVAGEVLALPTMAVDVLARMEAVAQRAAKRVATARRNGRIGGHAARLGREERGHRRGPSWKKMAEEDEDEEVEMEEEGRRELPCHICTVTYSQSQEEELPSLLQCDSPPHASPIS